MKIDLHIHTKKVLSSETKEIEINADCFKEKMKDNNIQIAAITNHNYFDKEQFNSFKDDSYLLLPGIEYDVLIKDENENSKRRQMNIIFNNDKIEEFHSKIVEIGNVSSGKPIDIEKIIKEFDSEDTIFYLDMKSNLKTKWSIEDYEKYFGDIKGVYLFDTNNIKTHFVLMANNFNSLIGSDVKKWNDYSKDAEKLIDTPIIFKTYENFISILKMNNSSELLSQTLKIKNIDPLNIDEAHELKNIFLTNGVNIIFGAKSTGKSALLYALHEELKKTENSFIYKSEDYQKIYEELLTSKEDDLDKFKKEIEEYKRIMGLIKNYEENKIEGLENFYKSIKNKGKDNLKIAETTIPNFIKPENNLFYNYLENNKESIENLESIDIVNVDDKLSNDYKKIIEKHKKLHNEIIKLLKKVYIIKNRDYISWKIKDAICDKIKKILLVNKGQFIKPVSIGLFKLFEKRKKLLEHIKSIKDFKKEMSNEKEKFDIPSETSSGNTLLLKHDLLFFDPVNDNKWGNSKKIDKWVDFKKNIKCLFDDKNQFKNPNEWIKEIKKNLDEDIDMLYYSQNNIYNVENKIYKPSNGEKAFIVLFSNTLGIGIPGTDNEKKYSTYFLDEPGTYLGNQMITETLIKRIRELIIEGRKIILTTHRSSLGINTIPFNFIYRDINKWEDGVYKTYIGYFGYNNKEELVSLRDENDTKRIVDLMLKYFEGSKEEFNFRKDVYEHN